MLKRNYVVECFDDRGTTRVRVEASSPERAILQAFELVSPVGCPSWHAAIERADTIPAMRSTPTADLAHRLEREAAFAAACEQPQADLHWAPRPSVHPETQARADALASRVREAAADPAYAGCTVAIEGVCRVAVGADKSGRGGERFTALVVHVVADAAPAWVVILPLE